MKKYATSGLISSRWFPDASIETVEVEMESETSIWVSGNIHGKMQYYRIYHDTFDIPKNSYWTSRRGQVLRMGINYLILIVSLAMILMIHQKQ